MELFTVLELDLYPAGFSKGTFQNLVCDCENEDEYQRLSCDGDCGGDGEGDGGENGCGDDDEDTEDEYQSLTCDPVA